jgi:hypothetical protein
MTKSSHGHLPAFTCCASPNPALPPQAELGQSASAGLPNRRQNWNLKVQIFLNNFSLSRTVHQHDSQRFISIAQRGHEGLTGVFSLQSPYYKRVRIKISVPGHYPSADLSQFLPGGSGRDQFYFNNDTNHADAWFVLEGTLPDDNSCVVPENRVFFLGAETARPLGYFYETPGYLSYLRQFAGIYSPQELYWDNAELTAPFLPWMINANHGPDMLATSPRNLEFLRGLSSLKKTKNISVFCSNQSMTPEHRARLRFVHALKDHFGDRLDWFGNGISPLDEKWDGLAPYKYTIVLENQAASHVLTEKIQDAFLALALPIYWGAPEAKEIFGDNSFVPIDIKDIRGSIAVIEELLEADPYEIRLPSLQAAKSVVTDNLNFLFRMGEILQNPSLPEPSQPELKTIKPLSHFTPGSNAVDYVGAHVHSLVTWARKWVRD